MDVEYDIIMAELAADLIEAVNYRLQKKTGWFCKGKAFRSDGSWYQTMTRDDNYHYKESE